MSNPADFKVKNGLVVNTTASFLSTITSTSTTTGGVIVSGGIGIVKDVWVGGTINVRSTTSATNTTSGALQVVGGAGIQGDLYARNIYSNGILIGTNAGNATTSTNLAGGSQYQIPYQSTSSSTVFILPPPTTQNSLLQFTTGTGFTWTNTTTVGGGQFFYNPVVDTFTSVGSTTTYTLSNTPLNKNILTVVVDGVTQLQSAFSLSGASLIFSEIPYNGANIDVHYANVISTSSAAISGGLTVNGILTATLVVQTSLPLVLNDLSGQANNKTSVFALKTDQTAVTGIVDSKDIEVLVNGVKLSPYVKEQRYPWITPYDSYKGFRVVTTGTTANWLVIYNPPELGSQVTVTQLNSSASKQTRKYPYSATTIALGD